MTRTEACHMLAEINEQMDELQDMLRHIESQLIWDDDSRKEWYLERKEEITRKIEKCQKEHDDFLSEYGELIYS